MSRRFKHIEIYKGIRRAIDDGVYRSGQRLPSEHELVERFGASRPTVARALRELQTQGLIERRAGSGSYVRQARQSAPTNLMFGLLIPDLGRTEIFEPICGAIARQMQHRGHTLLWSDFGKPDSESHAEWARRACDDYVHRKVAGVFFAPLELSKTMQQINRNIVDSLRAADIAIVLLDRDFLPFPQRSDYDLVSIDNHRGGHVITAHLLSLGCQRIAFLARPFSAPTVERRIAGYIEALWRGKVEPPVGGVQFGDPEDRDFIRKFVKEVKPDAIVCANDLTAASLMHTLESLDLQVPDDVRVVGFDDVKYARLLRVPLTTVHQPCDAIAAVATHAMLQRVSDSSQPPKHILIDPSLIVRRSCGSPTAT